MENAIFEEKKVSKAYMKLSLPLVLSMTVSLIYNLCGADAEHEHCCGRFSVRAAFHNADGTRQHFRAGRQLSHFASARQKRYNCHAARKRVLLLGRDSDWRSDGLYHASFLHAAALRHRRK